MAEKYEQLAGLSADAAERRRFGGYVKLYREMEAHFAEAESAQRARERGERCVRNRGTPATLTAR